MYWDLAPPRELVVPIAVGVSYEQARLGSWWLPDWTVWLAPNEENAECAAAMIRWLRLPILSGRYGRAVREFAFSRAHQVLTQWLAESAPPYLSLRWPDADDAWFGAVRGVFRHWEPSTPLAAEGLVAALADPEQDPPELAAVWRLMRVDPLLMGRVVRRWVREVYLPKYGEASTRQLLDGFCTAIAGTGDARGVLAAEERLLAALAAVMGVDSGFVKAGLVERALRAFAGQPTHAYDESNVALSLSLQPFRELLALRVLQTLRDGR